MTLNREVLISFFENSNAFQVVNLDNWIKKFRIGIDQGITEDCTRMKGHRKIVELSRQPTSENGSSMDACWTRAYPER
jgi:hypothetical protein